MEMEACGTQCAFKLDQDDLVENLVNIAWEANAFSDISVTVKGQRFNLHRLILSRSPYFHTLFTGKWHDSKKEEIQIMPDDPLVTPAAFLDVIGTLYGRVLTIAEDNVCEVFATASYFGMTAISQQCVGFIAGQLSPDNVIDYIAFSQGCEYELSRDILGSCEQYLCEHAFRDRAMHAKFSEVQLPMLLKVLKSDSLWIPSEYQRYCFAKEVLVRKMNDEDHSVADSAAEFSDAEPSAPLVYYMDDGKDSELYPLVQFPNYICHQPQAPSVSMDGGSFGEVTKDREHVGPTKDTNNAKSVEVAVLGFLKSGISYAHIHHDVVLDILKDVTLLKNKDISDSFRKGMCQVRLLQLLTEKTGNGLHVFAGLSMGDDFPPPFRFSVEFKKASQITDRMPGYSEKHFYGGSFWWLSCVRQYRDRSSSNDGFYGIYLHRDNTVKFPRPPYKDPRDKVLIDYTFRCRDISQSMRTDIVKTVGHPEVVPCSRLQEYTIDGSLLLTLSVQLVFQ